jgi:hypothetical protein
MTDKTKDDDFYPGEISIPEFKEKIQIKFNQVKRYWIYILVFALLSGSMGWFYAKQLPSYFAANILFILSSGNQQPSQNNIIAQQLGKSNLLKMEQISRNFQESLKTKNLQNILLRHCYNILYNFM